MSDHLPPFAALITHPVSDFDQWKPGFEDHQPARQGAGFLGHHLNRAEDDPNLITAFFAIGDLDAARALTESADMAETMKAAGVTGPPVIRWMQPVRQSIDWERELPAFILHHRVADFDTWLAGYDEAAPLRASKGIIGDAVNRWVDDPAMVTVYHQAESFDTLRAYLGDPELKAVMQALGVISAPEVTFQTSAGAKFY